VTFSPCGDGEEFSETVRHSHRRLGGSPPARKCQILATSSLLGRLADQHHHISVYNPSTFATHVRLGTPVLR
jgi:hypothetical protein